MFIDLDIQSLCSQIEAYVDTPEQFVVIPKGRRAGMTRGASQSVVKSLLAGRTVLWVDTIQANLDQYFHLYFLPILKNIPRGIWQYNKSGHELTINGSKLHMRSAQKPENIEGFGYHEIYMNESGIILAGQRGRDLWNSSVAPMIMDYNAKCFFIGTPKGKKARKGELSETGYGLFYEFACRGGLDNNEKDPLWKTLVYSSYTNPLLSAEAIATLESNYTGNYRRQELYGEFVDLGGEEIFKEEWMHIEEKVPLAFPLRRKIMSLDTAFKVGSENDCSAGTVWQETINEYYWIDCFNERFEFPQLIKKTIEFADKHKPDVILIEDAASGQSLIQTLRQETRLPIMAIKADKDKITRATSVVPLYETGKVKILKGDWNRMAINQLCEFNHSLDTMDDIVDSMTQALNYSKRSMVKEKIKTIPRRNIRSKILQGY